MPDLGMSAKCYTVVHRDMSRSDLVGEYGLFIRPVHPSGKDKYFGWSRVVLNVDVYFLPFSLVFLLSSIFFEVSESDVFHLQ